MAGNRGDKFANPEYYHDYNAFCSLAPADKVSVARENPGDEILQQHLQRWEKPIPFEETVNAPPFPTESLPAPIAAYVKALAESTQTSSEMSGILSLGVLSTAFQARYTVEVTSDWKEPLNLYLLAVAQPGERKSAVISALAAPITAHEAQRRDSEAADIAKNQAEREALEQALLFEKKEAAKNINVKKWENNDNEEY